jgi:site-specific DNA recombinase
MGGQPFAKSEVSRLLRNALYIGKVPHHDKLYDGEHPAILDAETFAAVQLQLKVASQAGGSGQATTANPLRGLVRCKACNCSMSLSTVTRRGRKSESVHRYFVCANASKRGRAACPHPSLPAGDLEQFVIDHLRPVLSEDATLYSVVEEARTQLALQSASWRMTSAPRTPETAIPFTAGTIHTRNALSGMSIPRRATASLASTS